jgi:hypothetical protein
MSENNSNDILQANTGDPEANLTGLADNFPIILNGVEYKYFKTWNIKRNDYIMTHDTEGGTQEDVVTRKGRKSIGVTVTCLQPLLAGLIALAELDEFEAEVYDPATNGYDTILVRVGAGSMSYSLKEKSAKLTTTNGVWSVSFTLEEF